MIYTDCPLYGLNSKRYLKHLLGIENNDMMKQDFVAKLISPYIDKKGKTRLIEPPSKELKKVQKKLKRLLGKIAIPNNVFSGIKGRSYADNALMHIGNSPRNLFKIDLTAFFPTISRNTVYDFFYKDLKCSPDVSRILTNLTTIDLEKSNMLSPDEVYQFLNDKNVSCFNHLISGAPTSQIMSYLVNNKMFDEIQKISDENNITMTIYVDDVTFSSECWIPYCFKEKVFRIIKKYGYHISKKKVKLYTKLYPKLVTGVVIDSNGKPVVKNSIRYKIISEFTYLKNHPNDVNSRKRLKGLLIAARQVDRNIFPTIYNYAFEKLATSTQ